MHDQNIRSEIVRAYGVKDHGDLKPHHVAFNEKIASDTLIYEAHVARARQDDAVSSAVHYAIQSGLRNLTVNIIRQFELQVELDNMKAAEAATRQRLSALVSSDIVETVAA